jgi:class 3 adenylate cyclase
MTETRKIATILAADVVGFTWMASADFKPASNISTGDAVQSA